LGLNAAGGAVFLFNAPASGGALIDALRYGLQTPDFSVARLPNGTGNWGLAVPSAGGVNLAAGLGSVSALRINEWMADPANGSDWIEILNGAIQPVALSGLFLTDDLADKTQSPLPPLSFVGTGVNAFVIFVADGDANAGADHVNFALKKSGEAIGLFSPSGLMLDGISFGPQLTGVSQGRFPDGDSNVLSFATTPTPGRANIADGLDSDNDGLPDAWETAWFGTLSRDGAGDFDDDSMLDQQEYWAGTSPTDPADNLRFLSIATGNLVALQFQAVAGKSYTVQYRPAIDHGDWQKLADVPPQTVTGLVTVTDPEPLPGERFYRLVTPALP
jgi:hypothetical protein